MLAKLRIRISAGNFVLFILIRNHMPDIHQPQSTPPRRLGIAADLVFTGAAPATYLLNSLLVYEQLVLPLNAMVLDRLLADFSGIQLKRLTQVGRLIFCPQVTAQLALRREPGAFSRDAFMASLSAAVIREDDRSARIVEAIEAHLVVGDFAEFADWRRMRQLAVEEFDHVAGRDGYAFLSPPSSPRYYRTGLETGMARVNDLLVAGISYLQFDKELPVLLEICFPGKARPQAMAAMANDSNALCAVENLHRIGGLPLVGLVRGRPAHEVDRLIDLVLSDEAGTLRRWLEQNWRPGLDVRDAYLQADRLLPSKQSWTGWLKFGAVTGVSTVVGTLFTDPVTSLAAGTLIGAIDQHFGGKTVEALVDPYHPSRWLSYLGDT